MSDKPLQTTRFSAETGIRYRHCVGGQWQHIDTNDGGDAQVGPHYASKAELLADHEAYLYRAGWLRGQAPVDPKVSEAAPELLAVVERLVAITPAACGHSLDFGFAKLDELQEIARALLARIGSEQVTS